jgi:hypothetical protein
MVLMLVLLNPIILVEQIEAETLRNLLTLLILKMQEGLPHLILEQIEDRLPLMKAVLEEHTLILKNIL